MPTLKSLLHRTPFAAKKPAPADAPFPTPKPDFQPRPLTRAPRLRGPNPARTDALDATMASPFAPSRASASGVQHAAKAPSGLQTSSSSQLAIAFASAPATKPAYTRTKAFCLLDGHGFVPTQRERYHCGNCFGKFGRVGDRAYGQDAE
ncbi:hypothetical protein MMC13_004492, partial [Lambiella insularis]|nr:hypothetical protein [Lambiella insularis]